MQGSRVAIAGIGETPYVRASERSTMDLIVDAAHAAIADAGLKAADIDGLISCGGTPSMDEIAYCLGIEDRPFTAGNDMVAGAATVGGALMLAQMAIEAGLSKHVMIPFGFKCSDPGGPYSFHERDPLKADIEMPVGYFGQPIYFAAMTQRYRYEHGLTEDDLAAVAMSCRAWAEMTPGAQRREPMSLADYQKSPMIATPLRAADCCLMTDGACAYIVTSIERARDLPQPAAILAGIGIGTNPLPMSMVLSQNPEILDMPARESAAKAYAMAGITCDDVDVAQLYDCFSISTIVQAEMLGFCPKGEGAKLFADGHTAPGGRLPMNTSGGHMSGGYLPGANLVVEAVRQVRHSRGKAQVPGAQVAVVTGLGANAHATTVLTREI